MTKNKNKLDDLFLIYINVVGKDWKGIGRYEFLFSDSIENIDGEDWDAIPAAGLPSPPHEKFVKKYGTLVSEDKRLDVVQESDSFSMYDAVDGVLALAWENMDGYEDYPESRIAFHFGDTIKKVEDTLYEHDLILEYKTERNGKLKDENN